MAGEIEPYEMKILTDRELRELLRKAWDRGHGCGDDMRDDADIEADRESVINELISGKENPMADGQLCLNCDYCGAEYRGKPAAVHPQRGYGVMEAHRLRQDAIAAGWVGEMTYDSKDKCPGCVNGEK
jgi:hypothetical protein